MNMEKEFYLTLLSNSSMKYFPNNTTTKFTTQLHKRIRLTENWSVGLAEIQYPCSFLAVTDTDNLLYYRTTPPDASGDEKFLTTDQLLEDASKYFKDSARVVYNSNGWFVLRIPAGNYENIRDIITVINNHELIKRILKFEYNRVTKRVSLTLNTPLPMLGLSNRLALQLGYKPYTNLAVNQNGSHPANIWVGLPSQMFIYCDIVEPQLVGDVLSPLVRIINISSDNYNYGCHKDVIFSPAHYIPVMRKEFENLEIDIRTETGSPVPFEFGTLGLKLHFKKLST